MERLAPTPPSSTLSDTISVMPPWLGRPKWLALLAAVFGVVFVLALTAPQRFSPSALIHAGTTFVQPEIAPPSLSQIQPGDGYDGQFYFRLALDPFTNQSQVEGVTLELPAYRAQRFLYPFLAWCLSVGRSAMLPWVLIGINLISLVVLVWAAARLFREQRVTPSWALALAGLPSVVVALAHDVPELPGLALLVGTVLALQRHQTYLAAVVLALGVLAYEPLVLLGFGLALVHFAAPELRMRGMWTTWALPIGTFVAAQAVLAVVWSEVPLLVAMGYLNRPLRGVVSIARELMTRHTVADILHLAGIALFLITMAVAAWSLRTTTLNRAVCLGWIFSVALMLFGTGLVYGAELTFWRAASMPLTLAVLIIATSQSVLRRPALLLGTSVGSLLAARLVWIAAGA